jgi:parvulin-like peptidyl-prolyl isomerase
MRHWVVMAAMLVVGVSGSLCAAASGFPATEPSEGKRVVAQVNQVEITYEEFTKRLESLEKERGPIPPEQFKDVVRGMIQEEILLQGATAEGLDQDPAVKVRLEQARRQVLIEELLKQRVLARNQVTDDETRKMYEDSKPLFSTDTVNVQHIMVRTQAEAEGLLKDLEEGKEFAELAKAKSQDIGSAEKGGDLGAIRRGMTVPEFEEEAFRLKEGELSPVIKTQYGYHIIKGGAHTTVIQPFAEVKDRIRQSLLQQRQRETFTTFMAELEKKATTQIFEDRLR